jgi:small neutral amino acid transporter SnatA (MarC family)
MADERVDPSGNTTQFQAFAERVEPAKRRPIARYVVIAVVALLLIAGLVALALG